MRIGIISDIHGNLVGLEAVLDDIERQAVDQIICLGDVATLGPQPKEVIAHLKGLDCACVMGNHETDVMDVDGTQRDMRHPQIVIDSIRWCADQLSGEELAYLGSFVPKIDINLGGADRLSCFHGSPQSNTDIILSDTPVKDLENLLGDHLATVMVGGHTHVQMIRQHMGKLIVNVGSVGAPMLPPTGKAGPPQILPWAEYAIVDYANGALGVELRRVPIDFALLQQITIASDNPLRWTDFWIRP